MKHNSPVTQREFHFSDSDTLLSTTDTDSHVIYANSAFLRASGFHSDEILGQPHNLVRHPDMPVEAFADMWNSLKAGESWTALVKNRRKDGDHYWVRANAAPMRRQGRLAGYLSVRTKPSRSEVQIAEQLYARFKQGQARRLAFHRGLLIRTGLLRWTNAIKLLPVVWRIRIPMLLVSCIAGTALYLSNIPGQAMATSGGSIASALLLATWFIESQIATPLKKIVKTAQQVASGETADDLQLDRADEIGRIARAINQSGLNLHSLVADVHEQVSGLRVASQQIAAANSDLSSRTEQTASSLEQTAAAMEQQTGAIRQNAATAQQASELANKATEVASRGGEAVSNVVTTMALIAESSKKIADISGVIDGIAFQTNILALNAAVEAARAGEQGRGFAVVASEVRSLAGRSAAAAKEIKSLIDASAEKVESGSRLVANAGETMTEVVAQVGVVNQLIAEITVASREQAQGIAQVAQAIAQLDEMTQQNAAMVEESGAAASSMSEQARHLLQAVQVFSH